MFEGCVWWIVEVCIGWFGVGGGCVEFGVVCGDCCGWFCVCSDGVGDWSGVEWFWCS